MKILLPKYNRMIGQPTFGTFASSNTQADASACKRAKPTEESSRTHLKNKHFVSNFCQPAREAETEFVSCKIERMNRI